MLYYEGKVNNISKIGKSPPTSDDGIQEIDTSSYWK